MNIEIVWADYQQSLKNFLRKHIQNQDDVDDLLQEILIRSYQNLPSVKDHKKVKSWLFQIANNAIIDFYRKRKTTTVPELDVWLTHNPNEQHKFEREIAQCVRPFIDRLPKEQAQLLTAIELDGVSQKEYARKTGVNYSTVKSRVQKSRQSLAKLFNQCCEYNIDRRGNIISYQPKRKNCTGC
ncbi:RNA polymerase sigma factor SigZ, partial [Vibrio sp. S4M6]